MSHRDAKIVVMALILGSATALAQAPTAAPTPVPSGPYASWPIESRKAAVTGLHKRCQFSALLIVTEIKTVKAAQTAGVEAFDAACMAHRMPLDWPYRTAALNRATSQYEIAKAADPKFPNPLDLSKQSGP